jgi:hypothetical protein
VKPSERIEVLARSINKNHGWSSDYERAIMAYLDERDAPVAEAETLTDSDIDTIDAALAICSYDESHHLRAKLARMRGTR